MPWPKGNRSAVGEPPATKGYTPSVFALLPRLLERAGTDVQGSITGLYTVLVEGDDFNEPISDAVRGILDGHLILSRALASLGHYPAVDVLNSISRVMLNIVDSEHQVAATKIKKLLAIYSEAKDLIDVGAYQKGSNLQIDLAICFIEQINQFLQQEIQEAFKSEQTIQILKDLYQEIIRKERDINV